MLHLSEGPLSDSVCPFGTIVDDLEKSVLLFLAQLHRLVSDRTYLVNQLVAKLLFKLEHVVPLEDLRSFTGCNTLQGCVYPQKICYFGPLNRVVSDLPKRVSLCLAHLHPYHLWVIYQVDASQFARVTFAHFLLCILERHDPLANRKAVLEVRLPRLRKKFAEYSVEAQGDVPCQLDVLHLVFSDWHKVRLIQEDVSGHQHWVTVQGKTRKFVLLRLFLFKLDHLVEPTQRSQSGQEPHHLSVSLHVRLYKQGALFRIDTAGKQSSSRLEGQLLRQVIFL